MLLTGDMISAEEAARIGLVNHVVAPGSERDEALKLAKKITAKSALTVKIGKEAFYRQLEMPLAEAYRYTSEVMVENMLARDAEEGIAASSRSATRSGKAADIASDGDVRPWPRRVPALEHREEVAWRLVVLFGRRRIEEMVAGDIVAHEECVGAGEIAADDAVALAAP